MFFVQPSFDTCARMESLLVKALNSQDNSTEQQFKEKFYGGDVDIFKEILTQEHDVSDRHYQMQVIKVLI